MTLIPIRWSPRRKAVWGPKRTFAILATLALTVFGLVPNAMAAGSSRHHQVARKAKAGQPNSLVKAYKLDNELTFRAGHHNPLATTRVIVELLPGQTLPAQFARYAKKNGKLGILNAQVVDLPNGLLKQMSEHPSVFRIHHDRATA
jgi:hypothetical protein